MKNILFDIEKNCGENIDNIQYSDPGNDPNFVFENDPLFQTLTLYDPEGNIINVNSWFECAHYVNGGWSSVNVGNMDILTNFSYVLLSLAVLITCFVKFKNVKK